MIKNPEDVGTVIGVDVGKSNHHAVASDRKRQKILYRALPQDEEKLRAIIKATAAPNRIRGLLTHVRPALAQLLMKYPVPGKLRKAGLNRVATLLSRHAPRAGT